MGEARGRGDRLAHGSAVDEMGLVTEFVGLFVDLAPLDAGCGCLVVGVVDGSHVVVVIFVILGEDRGEEEGGEEERCGEDVSFEEHRKEGRGEMLDEADIGVGRGVVDIDSVYTALSS